MEERNINNVENDATENFTNNEAIMEDANTSTSGVGTKLITFAIGAMVGLGSSLLYRCYKKRKTNKKDFVDVNPEEVINVDDEETETCDETKE